jgi:hypothetical protein
VTFEKLSKTLARVADLLAAQGAAERRVEPFRAAAARVQAPQAVSTLPSWAEPRSVLGELAEEEEVGWAVMDLIRWDNCRLLERLEGRLSPEEELMLLPDVGATLAQRIVRLLDVETLDEALVCAESGALDAIAGVGPVRRRRMIEDLRLALDPPGAEPARQEPPEHLARALDEDYRKAAAERLLPLVTPARHNPRGRRRLPVLHADRQGWRVMVHFANSARSTGLLAGAELVVIHFWRGGRERHLLVGGQPAAASPNLPRRIERAAGDRVTGEAAARLSAPSII